MLHIFLHVPAVDLIRTRAVCKRWKEFTSDQLLWKFLCQRDLRPPGPQHPPKSKSTVQPVSERIYPHPLNSLAAWEWLYCAHAFSFSTKTATGTVPATVILESPAGRYSGDVTKEGKRHGYGYFVEKNHNRYEGEWKDDKEHGRGSKVWKGGSTCLHCVVHCVLT